MLGGIPADRTSYNNSCEREYFTLGECTGLERPIIQTRYNNREYFTLGRCCGTERPIHMNKL